MKPWEAGWGGGPVLDRATERDRKDRWPGTCLAGKGYRAEVLGVHPESGWYGVQEWESWACTPSVAGMEYTEWESWACIPSLAGMGYTEWESWACTPSVLAEPWEGAPHTLRAGREWKLASHRLSS